MQPLAKSCAMLELRLSLRPDDPYSLRWVAASGKKEAVPIPNHPHIQSIETSGRRFVRLDLRLCMWRR